MEAREAREARYEHRTVHHTKYATKSSPDVEELRCQRMGDCCNFAGEREIKRRARSWM
jgi:hypothetical protein